MNKKKDDLPLHDCGTVICPHCQSERFLRIPVVNIHLRKNFSGEYSSQFIVHHVSHRVDQYQCERCHKVMELIK